MCKLLCGRVSYNRCIRVLHWLQDQMGFDSGEKGSVQTSHMPRPPMGLIPHLLEYLREFACVYVCMDRAGQGE